MRESVKAAVRTGAARIRTLSAPALIATLSASALAPVIAAAGTAGMVTAGAGVLGSVGANVLTEVITGLVDRVRADSGGEPTTEQVQSAVADRVEAAFHRAGGDAEPVDRDLRAEVMALLKAVDVPGAALEAGGAVDEDLKASITRSFAELAAEFGGFAEVLESSRSTLEQMHSVLLAEVERQGADRELSHRLEADVARIRALLRDLRDRQDPSGPLAPAARWDGPPYRGLYPFEEPHAAIFYGRRAMTDRLLDLLRHRLAANGADSSLLLVLGASGTGKSSLLRAGLLAHIGDDALASGSGRWPRRLITPGKRPLFALAATLANLARLEAPAVERTISARPADAAGLAAQGLAHESQPKLVLVVDQFEDLFHPDVPQDQRSAFVAALQALATEPALPDGSPAALVVAGLRADLLEPVMAYADLRAAVERGSFTIGPMSEEELREVITGPAEEARLNIPAELTAAVLADLRDRRAGAGYDSGTLPLLSQMMFVLWERCRPGMSLRCYRQTSGVARIVAISAEEAYSELTAAQQALCPAVFLHLSSAADGRLIRGEATRGSLAERTRAGPEDLDAVLDAFTARRLLIRSVGDRVALAHDIVLSSWPRLHDWLQPSLTDLALRHALAEDVDDWLEHNRSADYLYRGAKLVAMDNAVARWRRDPAGRPAVEPAVMEFLTTGRRRDRLRQRLTRIGAAALVILLLATTATTILYRRSADRARQEAGRATDQHTLALSRQFAAQSLSSTGNRAAAERLAAAALRIAPTPEAEQAARSLIGDFHYVFPMDASPEYLAFDTLGRVVVVDAEGTVRIWDPRTGEPASTFRVTGLDRIAAATLRPDGRVLATAGQSGLWVWNLADGRGRKLRLEGGSWFVTYSPDGRTFAAGSDEGPVRIVDADSGRTLGKPFPGSRPPAAFSADGKLIATATKGVSARLWNVTTRRPAGPPIRPGVEFELDDVALSPDADLMATGIEDPDEQEQQPAEEDAPIELWRSRTGRLAAGQVPAANRPFLFSPDGKLFAATTGSGYDVQLWDPESGRRVGEPLPNSGPPMAFSRDGKWLATAGSGDSVHVWRTATRQHPDNEILAGPVESVSSVSFSRDGRRLAVVANDGTVTVHDPSDGKTLLGPVEALTEEADQTSLDPSGVISPDGSRIAVAGGNAQLVLLDAATGKPATAQLLTGHRGAINAVGFAPDGRTLASAGYDQTVRLWNAATGRPAAAPLQGHTGQVLAVAFGPGGRVLASAGRDRTIRLWDPATGKPLSEPLTGHTAAVRSVAFSPDGKLLASAGEDQTVRLWDPTTGKPVGAPLTGHTGTVVSVAFSSDGRFLASAALGEDSTIRLWDPATGRQLGSALTAPTDVPYTMAISPDGHQLAVGGPQPTVQLIDATPYAYPLSALCARAGELTSRDWKNYAAQEEPVRVCG